MEETRKILVVGSDKQDCSALCKILNQIGIPVEVSMVHGEKNENLLGIFSHSAIYDCIFLNHHLPQDDASATVEQLQSLGIKIPIIVILNEDNGSDGTQIITSSTVEYVSKSELSSTTLAAVLRLCIRLGDAEKKVAQMTRKLQESNESLKCQKRELVAHKQLIRLQHLKLLEASQLKSQFLTTISHELRTPMNAVIGFAQVLLRTNFHTLTSQQTDIVERILNNGKHLLMLLNELLEFSGLENGDVIPKPEVLDLSQCIETTVAEVRSLADEKHLPIIVRNQLHNHIIFNDTKKMKQVLTNLLSNAIKFTESGYICVEVEELSEHKVAISVQDTGIGIATKDINSIFEPFWQVDQSTSRKYGGTGLGLAIAHSLVQIMCGKISVKSQLGEGSIFRVELPRQISPPDSHHIKDSCPGTVVHSGKKRLLF